MGYDVKSLVGKGKTLTLEMKDTLKLTDEEKHNPEILRHYEIFPGKGDDIGKLKADSVQRRGIQTNEDMVKRWGVVSPEWKNKLH